jgi:hypothetical protein
MSEADAFFQDARKSFRLAADSIETRDVEHYAGMGRDYLKLAHAAAKLKEADIIPSLWPRARGSDA